MKKMRNSIFLTLMVGLLEVSHSQLIGSRGIFRLPEGVDYRDAETLSASRDVARFARSFQVQADRTSEQNRIFSGEGLKNPRFPSRLNTIPGRKLQDSEVFDFVDSRYVDPLPETKFNKPLDEVEVERSTSPNRLFPGESSFGSTRLSSVSSGSFSSSQQQIPRPSFSKSSFTHPSNVAHSSYSQPTSHYRAAGGTSSIQFVGGPVHSAPAAPAVISQAAAPAVISHAAAPSIIPAAAPQSVQYPQAPASPSHSFSATFEVGHGARDNLYVDPNYNIEQKSNFYILNNHRIH